MINTSFAFLMVFLLSGETGGNTIRNSNNVVECELENLNQLLIGTIAVALDNLADLQLNLISDAEYIREKAILETEQIQYRSNENLIIIKNSALDYDVTVCFYDRENLINVWFDQSSNQLKQCILQYMNEAISLSNDSRLKVGNTIDIIKNFEMRLEQCQTDFCIISIIVQIEQKIVVLPKNIRSQVDNVKQSFEITGGYIQECAEKEVSSYFESATRLVTEIRECVNNIID